MAKTFSTSSLYKLRLVNFALTFALVGMVALIVSHAAVPAGYIGSYEKSIVDKVNVARTNAGLGRLQHIECLNTVAERWSKKMADIGQMVHSTQYPSSTSPVMPYTSETTRTCGGTWSIVGENVAAGYSTADSAYNAWMASTGHRANILRAKFTKTGVGTYRDSNGKTWWTQVFANCSSCTSAWSTAAVLPDDSKLTYYKDMQYTNPTGIPTADVTTFNYQFQAVNNGDIYSIKRKGTTSGMVEVNSVTAASGHKTWTGAKQTALPLTDIAKYDIQFQVAENKDLSVIRRKNTPSGMVEVARLTAGSGYKTWAFDKPTIIPVADLVTYGAQLQVADAGDLFYIKTKATSGSVVQVDRLAVLSEYKTWTYQKSTSVPIADVIKYNYKIQVMGNADLTFVRRQGTASGTVEVGRLTDASELKSWAFMKQSTIALSFYTSYIKEVNVAQDSDLFLVSALGTNGVYAQRLGPAL